MAVKNITPTGYEILIERTSHSPEIRITGERGQAFCTFTVLPLDKTIERDARIFQVSLKDLEQAAHEVAKITTMQRA